MISSVRKSFVVQNIFVLSSTVAKCWKGRRSANFPSKDEKKRKEEEKKKEEGRKRKRKEGREKRENWPHLFPSSGKSKIRACTGNLPHRPQTYGTTKNMGSMEE